MSHCSQGRIRGGGLLLCSLAFIELARDHRWENFRFLPFDVIVGIGVEPCPVDYLADEFPPETWYSEKEEAILERFGLGHG